MKILNSTQIKELDEYTIKHEPVLSIDLMERAASAFTQWFTERFYRDKKVLVFCGPGDNGGDGLAIARLLLQKMYTVKIYAIKNKDTSANFKTNEERLYSLATIKSIHTADDIPEFAGDEIIIDALFGSGLNKPVEGIFAEVISRINNSGAVVVSVDIPSGLYIDKHNDTPNIVKADYTISFQLPKLAFMFSENAEYVGDWYMLHIGLSREYIMKAETPYYYLDEYFIKGMLKPRAKFAHKGNFGKCLIIAGSYGMLGAAVLTAKACLRTGAGLVKAYVPESGFFVLQNDLPELIVLTDPHPEIITTIPDLNGYTAIGVGPGIGEHEDTVKALDQLLSSYKSPLVLDASALNILATHNHLLDKIPAHSILTPHAGEFERLAGPSENEYARLEKAKSIAARYRIYLVLKGAHTAIVTPEGKAYFNSTGNPGMATAGSGDVLTGIITSLMGQGYTPLESCLIGVFMHGYAGDSAARKLSQPSMIASDIIEGITVFYKEFKK
ncbi:MAG: NAD(P)H-hydrate dehydratase [Cytophagaceae bacterium]|nr:NAD(P)H-hydrate dehydratase [Cytophagaceae bacterium]MDW8456237.1 NAD(P)H-hydrate dehydratase [Cytophagaceae bacterium]